MPCIFCSVVEVTLSSHTILEDADTVAILDIHPLTTGHTLVIPRRHFPNLFELPEDIAAAVGRTTARVARLLQRELSLDGLSVCQANGKAAGQEVFHTHVHLIPRKAGDAVIRVSRPLIVEGAELASLAARLRTER